MVACNLKKEHKKIAYRFLKEIGLFNSFMEYIKDDHFYLFRNKKYIDDVFGLSYFSAYLMEKKDVVLLTSISNIFRAYVKAMYGNKYELRYNVLPDTTTYEIDKETGTIKPFFFKRYGREQIY